jgi:hypothetical protein
MFSRARAAILASNGQHYLLGNAGNGSSATAAATGVQMLTPGNVATASTPGTIQAGSYSTSSCRRLRGRC